MGLTLAYSPGLNGRRIYCTLAWKFPTFFDTGIPKSVSVYAAVYATWSTEL